MKSATRNLAYDMKSPANRDVVSGMRRVRRASEEFRCVAALLEKAGNGTLARKSARALAALDNAAPDLRLSYLCHGGGDAETVRRLNGIPAIAQSAREARKAAEELESALKGECPAFASSVRMKIANREAGKWVGLLAVGKKVAGAVAVAAAGMASYLYMREGLGSPTDAAAAVSGGAALAAVILGKGVSACSPAQVKVSLSDQAKSGLEKAISEVKRSLELLTGY